MLQWLAGQRPPDADMDTGMSTDVEPPETPAPVFAVRAFKHAIFGTPQTTQKKHRSQSSTEGQRARGEANNTSRPPLVRPKSANDTRVAIAEASPLPSPTKGILMTPGTAVARRKTVSFGDQVVDNEGKTSLSGSKTGLPDDFPGKFPSPWAQVSDMFEQEMKLEKGRDRSRLTNELHKAREESIKRRKRHDLDTDIKAKGTDEEEGVPQTFEQLKREYDKYRANTHREVKKLVTKQQAAKSFAREKDAQCTELSGQLRQEQKKVDKLEKRNAELEAQLKALRSELKEVKGDSVPKLGRSSSYPHHQQSQTGLQNELTTMGEKLTSARKDADRWRGEQSKTVSELEKAKKEISAIKQDRRSRLTTANAEGEEDKEMSLGPVQTISTEVPPDAAVRAVTSGTGATPLMSLSINALAAESEKHLSRQTGREERCVVSDDLPREGRPARPCGDAKRKDSYDFSQPSPQFGTMSRNPFDRVKVAKRSGSPEKPFASITSKEAPNSVVVNAADMASLPSHGQPLVRVPQPAANGSGNGRDAKENVSPSKQWHTLATAPINPAEYGVSLPATTVTSGSRRHVLKDGREVSADMKAEVKARMEARLAEKRRGVS